MDVVGDHDSAPERYRLGTAVTRAHSSVSLYAEVASRPAGLGARWVPLRVTERGALLVAADRAR